jgi:hypothetical protein
MTLLSRRLGALKKARLSKVDAPTVRELIADAGGGGGGGPVAWVDVTGKPSTFPPDPHTHPAADISDSTAAGRSMITAATAAAQRTLLSVETTAQLDARDTNNRARANHTGTQDASTITGSKLASFISDFASAVAALITGKQDALVSGTSIKTVNGNSLLGSGNVAISGGAGLAGTATVTPPLASNEWRETITATGVTPSSKVALSIGAHADTDENDPEFLDIGAISGIPGTDAITVILNFMIPAGGPIKLNWSAA